MMVMISPPVAAQSVDYGSAGPWTLTRNFYDGKVETCHATQRLSGDTALMFDYNIDMTSIAFQAPGVTTVWQTSTVTVWFDGNMADAMTLEMPVDRDWRVYRTYNNEPDGLLDLFANRNAISIAYSIQDKAENVVTFSLRGSNSMTKQTYDCVQNAVAASAPAPTPSPQPVPPPAPAPVQTYQWVPFSPGMFGPGIVAAGTMPDGMPVYVCALLHNGGFHPGMTGMWSDRCSTGCGGAEVLGAGFAVLAGEGRWRRFDGSVPADAVEGGNEADGRKLYVCRAQEQGAMLAGKFRPGFRGCNIGDGGSERAVAPFDLLTF